MGDIKSIKNSLEALYDIPFDVKESYDYNDPVYTIIPQNDLEELFSIQIYVRQGIRMIIEIVPQKYAASFVSEINNADEEKKRNFNRFYEIVKEHGAKVELLINQSPCNPSDYGIWNEEWKQFKIRITKIVDGEIGFPAKSGEVFSDWAKMASGLILSLLNIESLISDEKKFAEGTKTQWVINRYERNPVNREMCLAANGYKCKICGFDFEQIYGEIGKGFIHVHHIETVASHGGTYYLDPVSDMIPVCPNCHAMLHRKDPPYSPDEIKAIVEENNVSKES